MANDTTKPDSEDAALLRQVDESLQDKTVPPVMLTEPERPEATEPRATESRTPETGATGTGSAEVKALPLPETATGSGRRGIAGFVGAILGGGLCAAAGFYLGDSGMLRSPAIDSQLRQQAEAISALQGQLANRPAALVDPALTARIAALEKAEPISPVEPTPDPALASRLDALENRVADLDAPATGGDPALAAEVSALKSQVAGLQSDGGTGLRDALAGVQQKIDAAGAQADALAASSAAAAQKMLAAAALARIRAALDSGLPYGAALADLGVPAPAVLGDAAQSGLPTLNDLRNGFPDAARAGLEAALAAQPGEGWSDRIGSFLRAQTGARSLTPREGDDPDAVLSRAEAALAAGDLPAALTGVKSLPAAAQSAMAAWVAQAEKRQAAEAALADLATQLEG